MPAVETLVALKIAVGVTGVLWSAYNKAGTDEKAFNNDEAYKAVLGQFIGGMFYDFVKGGAGATLEKLQSKYSKINLGTDNLNHDLQKAARKAQLIATFFAAQNCLQKLAAKNNEESSLVQKVIVKGKEVLAGRTDEQMFFHQLINYLNEQIKDEAIENAIYKGDLDAEKFEAIFTITNQTVGSSNEAEAQTAREKIAGMMRDSVLEEIEYAVRIVPDFKMNEAGLDSLKSTLENGWEEIPPEPQDSNEYVSLNISDKRQQKIERFDWFDLVCGFFDEEYKNNPRVEAAVAKRQWSEISAKLDNLVTIDTKISDIVSKISAFAEQLNRMEAKLDEILAIVKEIALPIEQKDPPSFVCLPKSSDKVYGRRREIGEITKFLESSKKHGAIYVLTCFGKTSLVRKFIYKNLDVKRRESKRPELFTKIIYLDCQENKTFKNIARHFATVLEEPLEYTVGEEIELLKHEVFPKIRKEKILMVFDNFESWSDEKGERFLNDEIARFLSAFFNYEHSIRGLFIGWNPPTAEDNFRANVQILTDVCDYLSEGLDHKSALQIVRDEGAEISRENDEVDLETVDEKKLTDFFEKVYYIPQAIQSMIWLIAENNISFDRFLKEYWNDFEQKQRDKSKTGVDRLEKLRPAEALLVYQLEALSENSRYILSHLAFYDLKVLKELLLLDSSGKEESRELRAAFNRLDRSRLLKTETETVETHNASNSGKHKIIYCQLHEFVREVIRRNLPKFEDTNEIHLQNLADEMKTKIESAWKNKLIGKMFALAECSERLEDYFVKTKQITERQFQRDLVDFYLALASQNLIDVSGINLTVEQKIQLQATSERLYREFITKYPNYANAYNNLGLLLAEIEDHQTEAEESFQKAIELNSNFAVAYYNLGNLLAKIEDRQEDAETAYKEAIKLNPNDTAAYNNLGVLLAKIEDRQEDAEAAYKEAIKLNPNDPKAYYNLACLKCLMNFKDKCFDYLEKAIDLDLTLKSLAKTDSDFDSVRDDERFRKLVGDD
jgi:Flp pilus assembly protein TadD